MRGKYEKGSALIWAMMFVLIISILITSGLSIGLSFVSRSAMAKQEQQAYYTARSIVKGVTDWLQTARLVLTSPLDAGAQTLTADDGAAAFIRDQMGAAGVQSGLNLPEDMGGCELTIEGNMDSDITVTVRATLGNETYGVRSYLKRVTELVPGTPAYTPPEPPPSNPPSPPERVALPLLSELARGGILHSGVQLEDAPVDDGLSFLYPFELRRSEENILEIDDAAQAMRKALSFSFTGDHSPRFPPTVILNPAVGDAAEGEEADAPEGEEADAAEGEEADAPEGVETSAPVVDEAAAPENGEHIATEVIRYDAEARIVSLEGNYRGFRFYTGEGFTSPLTLGPMMGQPNDRGGRVYYTNASFVIEQGAHFRMTARSGLRGGEVSTYIPTTISGAIERGSLLTINEGITTFSQETYDAILSADGLARDDYLNNPRAMAPLLSEDSAILVKSGAVLRITAGEFLGSIYVEAGGRLELEGAPLISGSIYLYAPEEGALEEGAAVEGASEVLLPAELIGGSEGLSATVYAHPDVLIDPVTLEAARITLITKYFLGEAEELATPGTPDITTIFWTEPVFTGVS